MIETVVCGNGIIENGEECDDGNILNNDGCTAACKVESPVCGNRKIELGEECDDGNVLDDDGCSSSCRIQEQQAPPQQDETCDT